MRIQKEIENVERIENRQPVEPITMEDAVIQHKKAVDKYEEERKEINKELGLDDDIEEKGFTGASKEPKKVSTPELKKMKLAESLFESLNEGYFITDFNKLKRILKKIADDPNSIVTDPDYTTVDVINGKNCYCIYANGIEDYDIDFITHNLEDDFSTEVEVFDVEINSNNVDFNKLPDAAKEDLEEYGEEELNNSYYKCIALKNNVNESLTEGVEEINMGELLELVDRYNTSTPVSGDRDTETQHEQKIIADHFNLSMEEAKQVMIDMLGFEEDMFPVEEESLEEAQNYRQNQRRKRNANLDRQEAEARKRAEREKKLQSEEDWYKVARDIEDQEGDFGGYLDSKGYTPDEKEFITKYLDDIYNDENEKAAHEREYQRNKKIEAEKQAEEERKRAEQEKEEKTKKNLERIGKAANAPKDIGNALKKGLGNAGIHIG